MKFYFVFKEVKMTNWLRYLNISTLKFTPKSDLDALFFLATK